MTHYIINFTVYTLAMLGIIFIAFVVAKKAMMGGDFSKKGQFLSIESSLSLGPRKMLYVIKAGEEKFLISSDGDSNHLLTKLQADNTGRFEEDGEEEDFCYEDYAPEKMATEPQKQSVMRSILERIV